MEKNKKTILISTMLIIITIIVCFQCDTNPLIKNSTGIDSSVFISIAQSMKTGKLPYKDVFDHKGPLLYLINYIGISINSSSYIGIWIIENIFMFITLLYMYKISKLFIKSEFKALIPVAISIMPITIYLEGGNLTEEYALPFILISLFFIIKSIKNSYSMRKIESFTIGICMSLVLLLRPNMIPLWIIYCPIVFVNMLLNKKYKTATNTVIYFLLGTLLVIGTTIIVLQLNGILKECIDSYILFNFKYSKRAEIPFLSILRFFNKTTILISLSIVFCLLIFLKKLIKKEKELILPISSLLYCISTFVIVVLPRNNYLHYGMILIPTFIMPILLFIELFNENSKNTRIIELISAIVFMIIFVTDITNIVNKYICQIQKPLYPNEELLKVIQDNTKKDDKIFVTGNQCLIYLQSNREPDGKYIYQTPIINVDNNVKSEVLNELEYCEAKLIIHNELANKELNKVIEKLIYDNKYVEIEKFNIYRVLERN